MQAHNLNDILFTREQIRDRVAKLVEGMLDACRAENLVVVGILRGSFMFLADLVRELDRHHVHPRIDFMTLESYHGNTSSSGVVRITKDLSVDVTGADAVLVDDILDTGRTLEFACNHLRNKGVQSVKTCVLLDKPDRRVRPVQADFTGFTIEDVFVVGYGLDYEAHYRELPYLTRVGFPDPED